MPLFKKPQIVFWPRSKTVDIYSTRKDKNIVSFDLNLYRKQNPEDLQSLAFYLKKNNIKTTSVLLSDKVVLTRSFVYDTKINQIDTKEIVSLAQPLVSFPIKSQNVSHQLIQTKDKTIIQTLIYHQEKINHLKDNLSLLGLTINRLASVSQSLVNLAANLCAQDYFLIYPLGDKGFLLILAKADTVYLTSSFNSPPADLQKTINYSKLYFSQVTSTVILPQASNLGLKFREPLKKIYLNPSQIARQLKLPANLPLPVVSLLSSPKSLSADIIKPMEANNQPNITPPADKNSSQSRSKNILPLIAVFIVTAALASIGIWFFFNRNQQPSPVSPSSDQLTPSPIPSPTSTPTPTLAPINKDLKIQVLNATDINGQAASFKSQLANLGFTDIAVGNSQEKPSQNQVRLKSSADPSVTAYFKAKLIETFPASYSATLKDSSPYDVVFIIATDLRQAQTSTPTPALETETPFQDITPSPSD